MRRGRPLRQVARAAGVSLSTVQLWVARAQHRPLDEVDWADRSSRPRHTRRTRREVEDHVLQVRQALKATSDLGEFGAVAIRTELLAQGQPGVPAVRTLGRILERRGVLDRRRRVRRPPPPPGWYLPAVAPRHAELDSADIVEGLHIRGGPDVEVLTVISLHGGVVGAWPTLRVTAKTVVDTLLAHWRNAVRRERPLMRFLMRFLLGLTFPLVLDPDRKINVRYGVIGVAVVGTQRPIRSWCSCSWPWAAAGRR